MPDEHVNPPSADAFLSILYDELHRLAHHYMRTERAGHTLQTTALINEAYLRLVEIDRIQWRDRTHFVAMAATVMRRVLVDHARAQARDKRGGGVPITSLDVDVAAAEPSFDVRLLAIGYRPIEVTTGHFSASLPANTIHARGHSVDVGDDNYQAVTLKDVLEGVVDAVPRVTNRPPPHVAAAAALAPAHGDDSAKLTQAAYWQAMQSYLREGDVLLVGNKGADLDYGPRGPQYRENVQLRPAPHGHAETPAAVKPAMV